MLVMEVLYQFESPFFPSLSIEHYFCAHAVNRAVNLSVRYEFIWLKKKIAIVLINS